MVSVAVYLFVECMYLVPLLCAHGETSYWPIDAAMPSPKRGELERYRVRVSGVPANHVKLTYCEIDLLLLSSLRRLPARKSADIPVHASNERRGILPEPCNLGIMENSCLSKTLEACLKSRGSQSYCDNIHRYASCRGYNLFSYRLAPKCLIV